MIPTCFLREKSAAAPSRPLVRAWEVLPTVLAFAILAVQVWIPWSVPHFETQDGSSYVYSAVVARDLLFHPHSVYAPLYEFQKSVVPNWGTTIVLNVILSFVGVDHAEKLLMSLSILVGFFAFAYCLRSIAPAAAPWTPLANFILQNWLLWTGFYNFYLGTMLGLLVVGYYVRHANGLSIRRVAGLSIGLVAVFFTHLMAAALAAFAMVVIAVWIFVVTPTSARLYSSVRQTGMVLAMLFPITVLFAFFARSSPVSIWAALSMLDALTQFPLRLFVTAAGPFGEETYLWPVVLCYIAAAIALMRRAEWNTTTGGLALATVASFLIYLAVPDAGFGGGQAKLRFVWAIFIFGGMVAVSVQRLQVFRVPLALCVAGLFTANLFATIHTLWAYSAAVEDYISVLDEFPPGARIVRLRYPTPDIPERYGYHQIIRDPLRHVDGLLAARYRCIDLAEYQAPNHIFPIVFKTTVDPAMQRGLWINLEGPDRNTVDLLTRLLADPPGPVDYVIVLADHLSRQISADFPRVQATLDDFGMQMTAKSRSSQFIRVYKRAESP